jgi:hypothetical protein
MNRGSTLVASVRGGVGHTTRWANHADVEASTSWLRLAIGALRTVWTHLAQVVTGRCARGRLDDRRECIHVCPGTRYLVGARPRWRDNRLFLSGKIGQNDL